MPALIAEVTTLPFKSLTTWTLFAPSGSEPTIFKSFICSLPSYLTVLSSSDKPVILAGLINKVALSVIVL